MCRTKTKYEEIKSESKKNKKNFGGQRSELEKTKFFTYCLEERGGCETIKALR